MVKRPRQHRIADKLKIKKLPKSLNDFPRLDRESKKRADEICKVWGINPNVFHEVDHVSREDALVRTLVCAQILPVLEVIANRVNRLSPILIVLPRLLETIEKICEELDIELPNELKLRKPEPKIPEPIDDSGSSGESDDESDGEQDEELESE